MKYNSINNIEEAINKLFENLSSCYSTKVSFILSRLDISFFNQEAKHLIFTQESLIKLYLYKRIKGIRIYSKIKEYFKNNIKEAISIGFYKDEYNNLLFPEKSTFNKFVKNRLTKEDVDFLENIVEKILSKATKSKVLLDIDLVKKTIKDYKSKIYEQNKAYKEAVKLVKKLVYPQIDIKIKSNGKFTTKDLLDVLVHVAYSHDFANNGSKILSLDNEVPSGDLMMYHFNKINSIEEVQNIFDNVLDIILKFAKREYNILNKRKLNVAYDIHKIPFYGKKCIYVKNGKHENGTTQFFEFLTCAIVVAGRRFTIDVIPISPLDEIPNLLDCSLKKIKSKIHIDKVLLDRGFDNSKNIRVLNKNNVKFIMPKVRSNTVKAYFDKSEDCSSRIINDFKIGDEKANLILVDDKDGIKRAFITNFNIPVQLTHYLFTSYSKRWGIETSYRQMDNDFLARTTSNNYIIRLFYFLFSVCLYNLWVLVNICVSIMLYGKIKDEPIISSKLFAVVLYKVQVDLVDPGG